MGNHPKVAVIGLGALGLVTLKNLLEEGFDATGFERSPYVGGLWKYAEGDITSVLESTVVNVSKERGCYTDFPFPEGTAIHPSASEVGSYLDAYAEHFNLASHSRLNISINHVTRDEKREKWVLHFDGADADQEFDKVVFATGIHHVPNIPKIEGIEKYGGVCVHSRAFKRPELFDGKKVLIVGLGNTSADTATQLVGHATEISIAHRQGAIILPRKPGGIALDHTLSYRIQSIQDILAYYVPSVAEKVMNMFMKKIQDKAFPIIRPEWRLSPAPSMKQSVPIISDNLIAAFESGNVKSVTGLKKVTSANIVELSDGTQLEVDAIIWCTGYKTSFSLLESKYDPTANPPAEWTSAPGSNEKLLPRLYQNIFSLDHPYTLAFMGNVSFPSPAFQTYDIASMALTQIWKPSSSSSLPSIPEMSAAVDEHHKWVISLAKCGSVFPGIVRSGDWMTWANDAAGTGVVEKLGFGWKGWQFWLRERELCKTLMTGLYSPHFFRLFDGKRPKWDGAMKAIENANESIKKEKEAAEVAKIKAKGS